MEYLDNIGYYYNCYLSQENTEEGSMLDSNLIFKEVNLLLVALEAYCQDARCSL